MGPAKRKSSQSNPKGITPLLEPLQALQNLIVQFNEQGVIIGGIAVSLLGAPRYTVDIDAVFLLGVDDLPHLFAEAAKLGIEPRIHDTAVFAKKNRVVLLRHDASGTDIDILLGILPFEIEMVERSRVIDVGAIQLRLPTPEDLIIMKAVAHRPKDLDDIHAIAASHPSIDKGRIQFWVKQFGEALDIPDLWKMVSQRIAPLK